MTTTKNIIITVTLLLAFGLTANAQSSALKPFEGATHTYRWSGLQEGLDYDFYLTADQGGMSVLDDIALGEFDFVTSPTGTVGVGENSASVDIAWNAGAALHTYYVWFKVTNTSGCSNYRYVPVEPQWSQFDLLSENVPLDNTRSCPDVSSANGFNALEPNVPGGAGYTNIVFRVRRENGTDNHLTADAGDTYNWSFIPNLSIDPDLSLGKVVISVAGETSGSIVADLNERYSVSGFDDEVLVTVSIENAPGYDLDVTMTVTEQREDETNLSDSNLSNDGVTHTIEVMPVINSMGGV